MQAELSDGSVLSEIGRITAVDNAADEKTDTLYAAAEFKDPLGRLVPGSTVTITITLSKPDSLFPAVQPSALQHDAEGAYVWVVNAPQDGAPKTQKRRVEVGRAVNGLQLITAGLQRRCCRCGRHAEGGRRENRQGPAGGGSICRQHLRAAVQLIGVH